MHDPAAWAGSVLVSEAEREALRAMAALGLVDVYRKFEQPPKNFSWWDYRMLAFRRNHGVRIDLVLASAAVAARCSASTIDREPRKEEPTIPRCWQPLTYRLAAPGGAVRQKCAARRWPAPEG